MVAVGTEVNRKRTILEDTLNSVNKKPYMEFVSVHLSVTL